MVRERFILTNKFRTDRMKIKYTSNLDYKEVALHQLTNQWQKATIKDDSQNIRIYEWLKEQQKIKIYGYMMNITRNDRCETSY